MKKNKVAIFLPFILLFLFVNYSETFSITNKKQKKILYINSYYKEHPIEKQISKGIEDSLKKQNNPIIYAEYIDNRIYKNNSSYFKTYIKEKYKNENIDLIITAKDDAFRFIDIYNKEIFNKEIPVVFCGIDNYSDEIEPYVKKYSGVIEHIQIESTFRLALHLNQNLENAIFIVNDKTNLQYKQEYKRIRNIYKDKVKFFIIDDKNLNSIIEIIKSIKNNSAIFFQGEYFDENGDYVSPNDAIKTLNEKLNLPVYSYWFEYSHMDIVGGDMRSSYRQGVMAGDLAKDILYKKINNKKIINEDIKDYIEENNSNFGSNHNWLTEKEKRNYKKTYVYTINNKILNKNKFNVDNLEVEHILIGGNKVHKYKRQELFKIIFIIVVCFLIISIILLVIVFLKKRDKNKFLIVIEKNKKILKETKIHEKQRNELFDNISHEFRTPLNVLYNTIKLIEHELSCIELTDEKIIINNRLPIIKNNCYRLLRLGNNFIIVTEIENNLVNLNLNQIDIVYVVEDLVQEVVHYLKEKNIVRNVIFDTDVEEKLIYADKEKIEKVLLNLMSNSIKFSKEGDSIEVVLKEEENSIKIILKDNGIGICKEQLDEIFNKFSKVDSSLNRCSEGSGVGLYIVKSFLKCMRAKFNICSEKDKGTMFTLDIPIINIIDNKVCNSNVIVEELTTPDKVKIELSDIYN